MKKNIRIILDLNGVVQEHYSKQIKRYGIRQILRFKLSPIVFINVLRKVGKPGVKVTKREKAFGDNFYKDNQHINTPFLSGAKEKVKELLSLGHPIHICSANKHSEESDNRYAEFLTEEFGKFEEIHFVWPFTSKLDYYKSIKLRFPNDKIIVIDDSPRHIEEAKSLGFDTIKVDKNIGIAALNFKNLHKQ